MLFRGVPPKHSCGCAAFPNGGIAALGGIIFACRKSTAFPLGNPLLLSRAFPLGEYLHLHRNLNIILLCKLNRLFITRIDVPRDADAGIVCQHAIQALRGFVGAVGY